MQQEKSTKPMKAPSSYDKLPGKDILDSFYCREISETEAELEEELVPLKEAETEEKPSKQVESFVLSLPEEKKYFRIGEAAELIGVEPYVLRYWEGEFASIRPMKSKSGHRVYSRRDVKLFEKIRNLLYVEKFSVKGAKKQLLEKRKQDKIQPDPEDLRQREEMKKLVVELRNLIHLAKNTPCV